MLHPKMWLRGNSRGLSPPLHNICHYILEILVFVQYLSAAFIYNHNRSSIKDLNAKLNKLLLLFIVKTDRH